MGHKKLKAMLKTSVLNISNAKTLIFCLRRVSLIMTGTIFNQASQVRCLREGTTIGFFWWKTRLFV
jgi:hypothetical protein